MTLSEATFRDQATLEARGTSNTTMHLTSAALGVLLLASQPGLSGIPAGKTVTSTAIETAGTAAMMASLRITEQDLAAQLSRVYQILTAGQLELDAEAARLLYQNLWGLY